MNKFEHSFDNILKRNELREKIQQRSDEGWEMVSVIESGTLMTIFWKRKQ